MLQMSLERMHEIMQECDKCELKLANDPTVLGPQYLQDMIATCRNYTNHVARFLNEVGRTKMAIDRELRRKQTAFKIAADELLAKNLAVRSLPNIKDRESQINLMLKDEHREIVNLENDILDITHVEDYVKRRHRELKDTMREIQSQRNLLKDDRETGGMYGDERPTSMGPDATAKAYTSGSHARPDDMDEEAINKMLEESQGSTPESPTEPSAASIPTPTPTPVPEDAGSGETTLRTDEAEIRAFLDKPEDVPVVTPSLSSTPISMSVADDDFSEIIANL